MIISIDGEKSIWKILTSISDLKKIFFQDFPGGTVVKNPPANAGDTSSSPGPRRSHMPRTPQLLSPRATTTEAHVPRVHALQQEKPPQWEARALQQRVAPARHN